MGNGAGLKALQVVANSERALAIELLAATQAIEFLAPLEPGPGLRATHDAVRELSERVRDDRPLAADIERVAAAIRDGSILAAAEAAVGELR
jgi:histidine ammonia-lyase